MKQSKFGTSQITNETPKWAKWVFRAVFLLTKIIAGYVAATTLIPESAKYEITLFLTLIVDPLAFGFSKLFGVRIEEDK